MKSFYDFFQIVEDPKGNSDTPQYNIQKMDVDTQGKNGWEGTALTVDDTARYAADDVTAHIEELKKAGFNPTKLGDHQMTDDELRKFQGLA